MRKVRKIGFLGGSFDPIHLGHINLAIELKERHQLDQVLLCPTSVSPHKLDKVVSDPIHRLAMVKLAREGLEDFEVCDKELDVFPAYTVDTLKSLKQENPHDQFFLLLGEDLLTSLHTWKEVDFLLELAFPLIGTRVDSKIYNNIFFSDKQFSLISKGLTYIPLFDISSTQIRQRLLKGQFCGHLLPGKVLDYIQRHRLYL